MKKNAWMFSFIDLLSIMLAFFILFYSLSGSFNKKQIKKNDIDINLSKQNSKYGLEYLKYVLNSQLMLSKINIYSNIYTECNKLVINLKPQDVIKNEKATSNMVLFLDVISQVINNIDAVISVDYNYINDSKTILEKLINLKQIFNSLGFKKDIELFLTKVKGDEYIRINLSLENDQN